MRVFSLVLCLVFACATSALAQERAAFGVKGGVNFANITFDVEGVDINFDKRTGLVAGAFVVWPAEARVALQLEALYSQKGARFDEQGSTFDVDVDYLDVPILARVSTPLTTGTRLYAFGGPLLAFRLRARGETLFDGEGENGDISDEVEPIDFGLVAGAGVEFGRMLVDARYTWGLKALNKEDTDEVKVKSRVFSIMAGFRF